MIDLYGFKCFANLRLELGSLTLFTGYNSAGKSSAIQPLLLLAQAARIGMLYRQVPLNGALVSLGTAGHVANAETAGMFFGVSSDDDSAQFQFVLRPGARWLDVSSTVFWARSVREASGWAVSSDRAEATVQSLASLSFLSALRANQQSYPLPSSEGFISPDVGNDGRFAAYWLDQFSDNEVVPERRHPGQPAPIFRKQLDAWMGELFPGAQVAAQYVPAVALESLSFRQSDVGEWRTPINVGYGLTYAFPLLVALLMAEPGKVVVVDSPEAHLHPSAQSRLGQMLGHFATSGVQIVVETHSDHLLNGARLAVKRGLIWNEAIRVHFFSGASDTSHGVSTLPISPDGSIADWPMGFFDQAERDLAVLAGWTSDGLAS
jgi:predicted ATPase